MAGFIPQPIAYFMAVLCGGLGILMLRWQPGPNAWIGVRLPWTFADRQIWDKSWRLAAIFLLGMGVGILVSLKFFVIAVIHLIVLGILYPAYLYRRRYGTLRYWKDMGWLDYRPVARCPHCGHLQKLERAAALAQSSCEGCGRGFQDRWGILGRNSSEG